MRVTVLGTDRPAEWSRELGRFPGADVYFSAGYHLAHERNGDGRAHAYAVEDGDDALFYPFLLRPIEAVAGHPVDEAWTDIETVYGYSGPLATSADPDFLARVWAPFAGWCAEHGVVAEFVRFNPLSGNRAFASPGCRVAVDRETVAVDLTGTAESLWERTSSTQRNMVRKAQSRGLTWAEVQVADGLDRFVQLYAATMDRVGASDYYRFPRRYFADLAASLGEALRLFVVRDGDAIAAAALFLLYGDRIHYHLAGSDPDYRTAAANNLLLHGTALWAQERKFFRLHLGGGASPDPEDPLFRFKAAIGDRRLEFAVGRRVHDAKAYEGLCNRWLRSQPSRERPAYFLLYRLEDAA